MGLYGMYTGHMGHSHIYTNIRHITDVSSTASSSNTIRIKLYFIAREVS
jgi:hypothetical protein